MHRGKPALYLAHIHVCTYMHMHSLAININLLYAAAKIITLRLGFLRRLGQVGTGTLFAVFGSVHADRSGKQSLRAQWMGLSSHALREVKNSVASWALRSAILPVGQGDSKSLLTKIHWRCPRPSVRMRGTPHGEFSLYLSTQNSDTHVRVDKSQPLTPAPHLPPGNFNPA